MYIVSGKKNWGKPSLDNQFFSKNLYLKSILCNDINYKGRREFFHCDLTSFVLPAFWILEG